MKKNIFLALSAFWSIISISTTTKETDVVVRTSPHNLVLFMGPQVATPVDETNVLPPDASDMEKVLKVRLKKTVTPPFSGAYITYYGSVTTIDELGKAIFPRRGNDEEVTLVVTKGIRPIVIQGNTVEQLKRKKKTAAAYYLFKRTTNENGCFWEVSKLPLPENRVIPPLALILYARPEDIFVPEGVFTASCGPDLVLPTIYPTRKFNGYLNALSFMKISKYFAPIHKTYKYLKDRYAVMIS